MVQRILVKGIPVVYQDWYLPAQLDYKKVLVVM
jgi:hypothetical protein